MPSERKPRTERRGEPKLTLNEIMQNVVAHTLPPAPGTILILTAPANMDWANADWVNAIQVAAERTKAENGFAGVIVTSHGSSLHSMNAEQLARIGLQVIPGAHDMATQGSA